MKKTLIALLSCLCAMGPLSAAYQYGDYVALNDANGSLNVVNTGHLILNFTSSLSGWNALIVEATDPSGNTRSNTVDIDGKTISIGTFQEGESLKFFLTGEVGTTTNAHFWGSGWDNTAGTYDYLHFGGNYGPNNQSYTQSNLWIEGGPAPSGQPLPGILISLLIGGALVGFLTRKKQHRKLATA